MILQRAELLAEQRLLVSAQTLIPEYKNGVIDKRPLDRRDQRRLQRLRQIDAGDFGDADLRGRGEGERVGFYASSSGHSMAASFS